MVEKKKLKQVVFFLSTIKKKERKASHSQSQWLIFGKRTFGSALFDQTRSVRSDFINRHCALAKSTRCIRREVCWISKGFVPGQWRDGLDGVLRNPQGNNLASHHRPWIGSNGGGSSSSVVRFKACWDPVGSSTAKEQAAEFATN